MSEENKGIRSLPSYASVEGSSVRVLDNSLPTVPLNKMGPEKILLELEKLSKKPLQAGQKPIKFAENEVSYVEKVHPERLDYLVLSRIQGQEKVGLREKLPGTQIRLAFVIAAADDNRERLNPEMKDLLNKAIESYHNYGALKAIIAPDDDPQEKERLLKKVEAAVIKEAHADRDSFLLTVEMLRQAKIIKAATEAAKQNVVTATPQTIVDSKTPSIDEAKGLAVIQENLAPHEVFMKRLITHGQVGYKDAALYTSIDPKKYYKVKKFIWQHGQKSGLEQVDGATLRKNMLLYFAEKNHDTLELAKPVEITANLAIKYDPLYQSLINLTPEKLVDTLYGDDQEQRKDAFKLFENSPASAKEDIIVGHIRAIAHVQGEYAAKHRIELVQSQSDTLERQQAIVPVTPTNNKKKPEEAKSITTPPERGASDNDLRSDTAVRSARMLLAEFSSTEGGMAPLKAGTPGPSDGKKRAG